MSHNPTLSDLLRLIAEMPAAPANWRKKYFEQVLERANRRFRLLNQRVGDVVPGRTMPTTDQVTIGSGRHLDLAIMFLDISGFTTWPCSSGAEQKSILWVMNVFMAEMMNVVRDHQGVFEKNTGDGLMAYFGTEMSSEIESVHAAAEAAVLMHYINDEHIAPWLERNGFQRVRFRIGIDFGPVTVARIGIHGTSSFVAIGAPANIANRLLRPISEGISIGNEIYTRLPANWDRKCVPLPPSTGYVYSVTGEPYPIWELKHRMVGHPAR